MLGLFGASLSHSAHPAVTRRQGNCVPFSTLGSAPECIIKHKIDNKNRQKHRYNTIPTFRNIFLPRNYTDVHFFLIQYMEDC